MLCNLFIFEIFFLLLRLKFALTVTCYFYPNFPDSFEIIYSTNCEESCCNGIQITDESTCCNLKDNVTTEATITVAAVSTDDVSSWLIPLAVVFTVVGSYWVVSFITVLNVIYDEVKNYQKIKNKIAPHDENKIYNVTSKSLAASNNLIKPPTTFLPPIDEGIDDSFYDSATLVDSLLEDATLNYANKDADNPLVYPALPATIVNLENLKTKKEQLKRLNLKLNYPNPKNNSTKVLTNEFLMSEPAVIDMNTDNSLIFPALPATIITVNKLQNFTTTSNNSFEASANEALAYRHFNMPSSSLLSPIEKENSLINDMPIYNSMIKESTYIDMISGVDSTVDNLEASLLTVNSVNETKMSNK